MFFYYQRWFLRKPCQKKIQFSEVEVAANFDITSTSIYVQRITGHVYDWSVLNEYPIQNLAY